MSEFSKKANKKAGAPQAKSKTKLFNDLIQSRLKKKKISEKKKSVKKSQSKLFQNLLKTRFVAKFAHPNFRSLSVKKKLEAKSPSWIENPELENAEQESDEVPTEFNSDLPSRDVAEKAPPAVKPKTEEKGLGLNVRKGRKADDIDMEDTLNESNRDQTEEETPEVLERIKEKDRRVTNDEPVVGMDIAVKEQEPTSLDSQSESLKEVKSSELLNGDADSRFDWWPDLSDLDRLNIQNAPLEDRARLLSAKVSMSIEHTMQSISDRKKYPLLDDFKLPENPTRNFPLRLIHAFSSLPIQHDQSPVHEDKVKVLCVDDDESILRGYQLNLRNEFDLHVAKSGESGIEIFKKVGEFSVVLSDMRMPGMNGSKMLAEINKIDPNIVSVLITGHSDFEVAKEAINSGKVFKILTKPCSADELIKTLKECSLIHQKNVEKNVNVGADDGKIHLLTVWPPTARMSRWVYAVSGRKPIWYLGLPEKVTSAITENFGIGSDSLDETDLESENEDEAQDDLEDQNAAIIRFVNEVVQKAIVDRATDIHFEPHKDTLQIRYRIDGQLVPVRVPDNLRSFQDAIISRIKIMAGINISEKRRPQGGRITFSYGQSDLDIRVSTLPTLYGESISLRLLNEKSQPLSMPELGLLPKDEKNIVSVLDKPHGIVLVTGPTGSGKSTSLTAFIRKIHKPERRIMTVEDPVEYEVAGINQTQVNSEIGFNFASALREILRQDPDVIMVGEIRDRETADIAIRASLTGHLVLSTLHTNDAPGAITRLIDMEIEPFLIASSVEMVIAQRLVRRLCQKCFLSTKMSEKDLLASLSLLEIDSSEKAYFDQVRDAQGCPKCQNLGYRGRVGIFELMRMSDEIHSLVIKSASAPDIREVALKEGMSTLQGSGWQQIKRGLTTIDEVIRYADGSVDDEL
jgi:type II secretory ATPase GspE/PulE/Tfp pilus assembly ATPase PilB-like protein